MLLAIDCGNTNTVFSLCDGDEIRATWRMSTRPQRTSDEYAVWLTQLMALRRLSPSDVDAAIIANVVPPAQYNLIRLVKTYFATEPLVLRDPKVRLGIDIKLDRPEQVGADRLANAIGGFVMHGGNLIILDFGTATSFDLIDNEGHFIGSILAPGVNLSVEALYMAASALPRIAIRKPDRVVGKATIPAMESGVFWGYVSMIEGLVERVKAELQHDMKVIATGGLAALFADVMPVFNAVEPDLTIRGLIEIHRRNTAI